MSLLLEKRPATIALVLGVVMSVVFVALVLRYDHDLRAVIHDKMIQRDTAVLTSVAQQEIDTGATELGANPDRWLSALLPAARREGVLAMAIYDADGVLLEKIPSGQLMLDLPIDEIVLLEDERPVTRYWPAFSLATLLVGGPKEPTPVLEIVVPLHGKAPGAPGPTVPPLIGFVRYHLDGRPLAVELATLDAGVRRQTVVTLTVGLTALALIVGAGYILLRWAQRTIAERTARLQRANFELTLAAKTSALGQLTSHLIHGLQGSVAGLRSVISSGKAGSDDDWSAVAGYAEQMQLMIQETVGLLGDRASGTQYDLTGKDLTDIIRRRNAPAATRKGVVLDVADGFTEDFDNHRGGLLCLIASNLVQNAIEACASGDKVNVSLTREDDRVVLMVADTGPGIPVAIREHLFEPGHSGRAGGTGLGLAISQLLARQIGAMLAVEAWGPDGTIFRVTVPDAGRTSDVGQV